MCGIAGIFRCGARREELYSSVSRMISTMRHRGPDGEGIWQSGEVVLGHTRLAVIDLTEAASQPMVDESTGVAVVYNGEIYNYVELRRELLSKGHQFKSHSDTEVLLRGFLEWDVAVFEKFIGMWACAIYVPRVRRLVLSRDRFGIKPLCLMYRTGEFAFASTIGAICAGTTIQRSVNPRVAREYLLNRSVDTHDETFLEGIQRLAAGAYAEFNCDGGGEVRLSRYWDLGKHLNEDDSPAPFNQARDEFRGMLGDTISLHTRSDVEVATCLSGGLDSSSIVALLATMSQGEKIRKVFSAFFPGEIFDESNYSKSLTLRYDLEHLEIFPTTKTFLSDIDTVIEAQEEPFGSTGVYVQWKIFETVHQEKIKVILDGQGADEYLAGYFSFLMPYALDCLTHGRLREAGSALAAYLRGNNCRHYMWQNSQGLMKSLFGLELDGLKSVFEEYLSPRIADAGNDSSLVPEISDSRQLKGLGIKRTLARYVITHSLPSLLRYEDRNSMWFSVESRVPYLDHRLVEYCFRLPANYLIGRGVTKRILRESVADIVPEAIVKRKDKIGFGNPERDWVYALVNQGRLDDLLGEKEAGELVNVDVIRRRIRNGVEDIDPNFLWRVFNILLWYRQQRRQTYSIVA